MGSIAEFNTELSLGLIHWNSGLRYLALRAQFRFSCKHCLVPSLMRQGCVLCVWHGQASHPHIMHSRDFTDSPSEQSSGKGHVSGIGLTCISKGIICCVYRCEKDKARKEKMIFFTEPCWERDREENGAVHQCLMAHRQQKWGSMLRLGFFLTCTMKTYNLEPAGEPELAQLEKSIF